VGLVIEAELTWLIADDSVSGSGSELPKSRYGYSLGSADFASDPRHPRRLVTRSDESRPRVAHFVVVVVVVVHNRGNRPVLAPVLDRLDARPQSIKTRFCVFE